MKTAIAVSLLFLASVSAVSAQDPGWPRTITTPQGTLVYYQPQVDNWNNFQEIDYNRGAGGAISPGYVNEVVDAWAGRPIGEPACPTVVIPVRMGNSPVSTTSGQARPVRSVL